MPVSPVPVFPVPAPHDPVSPVPVATLAVLLVASGADGPQRVRSAFRCPGPVEPRDAAQLLLGACPS